MHRLESYFARYAILSKESRHFLSTHGRIKQFKKGDLFIGQHEMKHKWCFLLDGLIGYETVDNRGRTCLERLGTVHQYFVGTKHIYSPNKSSIAIRFLQDSAAYVISNIHLQTGIRQFAELSHIYHILKQHHLDSLHIFIRLPHLERVDRLSYIYQQLPEIEGQLTVRQLNSLLGYTNSKQYYQALDKHHRTKLKK